MEIVKQQSKWNNETEATNTPLQQARTHCICTFLRKLSRFSQQFNLRVEEASTLMYDCS